MKAIILMIDLAAANSSRHYKTDCETDGFLEKDISKFLDFRVSNVENLIAYRTETTNFVLSGDDEPLPDGKKSISTPIVHIMIKRGKTYVKAHCYQELCKQ
ncbi:hypothetical protein NPIL_63231 [Nephila pilipes]|uniref:Uncharacterized protein n=1 Tax=Nephila pilipes TaxID=299642 RepID=A0A8X6PKB4_NEPPI|nr:hypothetical protein NPIL_63231 [Nephila pilipes]